MGMLQSTSLLVVLAAQAGVAVEHLDVELRQREEGWSVSDERD